MSAESNTSASTPLRSIGAQDLINGFSYTKAAFVRKRGKRERMFDRLGFIGVALSKRIKWRQHFVVVSKGCLYIYQSEGARAPQKAISLAQYNSLQRTQDTTGNTTWCFIMMPHINTESPCHPLSFSCISERDRLDWMYSIKNEMIAANGSATQLKKPNDDDDYVTLEEPIMEVPILPKNTGYSLERKVEEVSDEPEDDYNVIDESLTDESRRKLPPIPGETDANKNESKKILHDYVNERPKIPSKPNQALCRAMFYFEGGREEAISELEEKKQEGTFLVRKSRTSPAEVLSVLTNEGVKEYKIQREGDKVMLNNNMKFQSIEDLLKKYQTQSLPNRTLTLSRPFMTKF